MSMAIDTARPMSRRALVGGTLGAIGAAIVTALARPLHASATSDAIAYTNDENNNVVLSASSLSNGPGTGQGIGVNGHSDASVGVHGTSGTNVGVRGDSQSSYGVWAESQTFHALAAFSDPGIGVWGQSGSNAGVRGESISGRGGVFKGKPAQVRLLPSSRTTHPASGLKGDLFVDASGRIWFCKGGSTWRQLA
jgi:hypothetical protein